MTNQITTINGTPIVAVKEDDQILIPIKPICDALGIAYPRQYTKLQNDEFLASTVTLRVMVAADGKEREMVCLPLRYVYGWLATINPANVAPEARDTVARYRQECYDVLYNHFTASMQRTIAQNEAEIQLLQEISDAKDAESNAKADRKKAESALDRLRKERLNREPTLFNE